MSTVSGGASISYGYDAKGYLSSVNTNGSDYSFLYDARGNTTSVKVGGNTVASYIYDAWGNATITVNQNNVAQINPIRYRGYYYDSESGLCYLISRYRTEERSVCQNSK